MIFQFGALALILVITFLNSMYGLFSGLINLFCAILAMATALGFFEPVNSLLTGTIGLSPSYAAPVALISLFIVTLIVLRTLADLYVRGNVTIPMYVDWAGGGLCGFILAQISVGMLVMGFLMLPFGDRVAQYSRFLRTEEIENDRVRFIRSDLWLKPDSFTASLFGFLSHGSLRGGATFASVYPDFPKWISWTGNTVQEESWTAPRRSGNQDGFTSGLKVIAWWDGGREGIPARYRLEVPSYQNPEPAYKRQTFTAEPGMRLLGVRIEVTDASADGPDRAGWHRFRPTMIRVVGTTSGESSGQPTFADYCARLVRGADEKIQDAFRISDPDNNFAVAAGGANQFDVYFEVPEQFLPEFVEYRRFARAAFASVSKAAAAPAAPLGGAVAQAEPAAQPTASGQFRFIDALVTNRTGNLAALPFVMSRPRVERVADVEVRDETFVFGRVFGPRESFVPEEGQPVVREFSRPEDRAIFQFTVKPKRAESLAGGVFNFVAVTANQYKAFDNNGNDYPLSGCIAMARRSGREVFEMFWLGDKDPAEAGFRGGLDFKNITSQELRADDTEITLMFLVKKGATMVRVENQVGQGIEGFRFEIRG